MAKWPRVYNACEKTGTRTLTSSQQPATLAPGNLIPSSGLFLYLHSHESTHVHAPQHSYLYIFKQEKSKCVIVFNKQPRQIIFPFFFLIMYRFLQRTSTIFRYQWKHTASQHCWATPSLCHPFPKCQQAMAQQIHECQA